MAVDTIVRVDPSTLLVGPNVRNEVELDDSFLESIEEVGVKTPITVIETPEGLVVIDGQRRTLAAVAKGLKEVPVFVTEVQTEAERIIDQVVVNGQRSDITSADAIAAVQELALFNMAVPVIAKQTGLEERFVARAVKVGSSAAAKKAMAENQLSFDYAVTIAEFDEFPEEQKELLELAAGRYQWQVRDKADAFRNAREQKRVSDEIKALGLQVVKEPDYYTNDPKQISDLWTDKAKTALLSDLPHEKVVELVGDGLRAFAAREWVDGNREWVIGYAVAGWEKRGLFGNKVTQSKAETPADAEAAKEERRVARENTKAWVEAGALRIEFLQSLVARKTLPKGWEILIVDRMLDAGSHASSEWKFAHVILQLQETSDSYSLSSNIRKHAEKTPTLAAHVGLAVWAATIEGGFEFERKGWQKADHRRQVTARYLTTLASWGHKLSEIEQLVVDEAKKGKKAA